MVQGICVRRYNPLTLSAFRYLFFVPSGSIFSKVSY